MTLACLLLLFVQETRPEERSAVAVRPVRGDLRLWRAEKLETLRDEMRVGVGDRLGSAKGEHALLSAEETVVGIKGVEAGKDRGLAVERVKDELVFRLFKGRLVVESFKSKTAVETPDGRATGQEATFIVEVTEDGTRVIVLDGTLTFSNPLGSVKLEPGQETTASKEKAPSKPKPSETKGDGDAPGNLVRNPGFENGLSNWTLPSEPAPSLFSVDKETRYAGDKAVRIALTTKDLGRDPARWLGFRQELELVVGRRYLVRAYLRAETKTAVVTPVLALEGTADADGRDSWKASCEGRWKMVHAIVTAKQVKVKLSIEAKIEGESFDAVVWGDEFYLAELPPK